MPFDDLLTPVAVPAEQRHDGATCCGERHVTECRSPDSEADETSHVQITEMSITDTWAAEVARLSAENHLLTAEVERLRLRPDERKAIELIVRCIDAYEAETDGFSSGATASLCDMLKRLGGGE
jgi:hypothetical protein